MSLYKGTSLIAGAVTLQKIYDAIHPVNEVVIGFTAPVVPEGVTATWTLDNTYNGKALWVDNAQTAGTELAGSLPNITGSETVTWTSLYSRGFGGAFDGSGTRASDKKAPEEGTSAYYWSQINTTFDASRSNSVYAASAGANVVRPTSVVVHVYKRTA